MSQTRHATETSPSLSVEIAQELHWVEDVINFKNGISTYFLNATQYFIYTVRNEAQTKKNPKKLFTSDDVLCK